MTFGILIFHMSRSPELYFPVVITQCNPFVHDLTFRDDRDPRLIVVAWISIFGRLEC